MARKLFGTDGIRGKANTYPMTPEVMMKLAMAAAGQFTRGHHRHSVVVGKDTRLSGYMIESALMSGFTAMGFKVYLLGPLPTPAVALLTKSLRADLGVMISASHNEFIDNGVKFFGPDGYKLGDLTELAIEAKMEHDSFAYAPVERMGKAKRIDDASGRYIEFAKSTFPKNLRLDGLKIVVDCAHGAAYKVAPAVLWELGAEIVQVGTDPNGININDGCGATKPDLARKTLLEHNADIAVVLDGDADRILLIDEKGTVLDGDQILALVATHFLEQEQLRGTSIVATHMSNIGLERYLVSLGLDLLRTPVGDRYVIEAMKRHNLNVGGEQSGHVILHDYTTTGDGLIAALQILAIMQKQQKPLSDVARIFTPLPQILKNIRLPHRLNLNDPSVSVLIEKAQAKIGQDGYLLVRMSGTEPVLRLMAQGDDAQLLEQTLQELAHQLEKEKAA
jgi:phosphoglucosamine mutase